MIFAEIDDRSSKLPSNYHYHANHAASSKTVSSCCMQHFDCTFRRIASYLQGVNLNAPYTEYMSTRSAARTSCICCYHPAVELPSAEEPVICIHICHAGAPAADNKQQAPLVLAIYIYSVEMLRTCTAVLRVMTRILIQLSRTFESGRTVFRKNEYINKIYLHSFHLHSARNNDPNPNSNLQLNTVNNDLVCVLQTHKT